jgi:hypothetical protein
MKRLLTIGLLFATLAVFAQGTDSQRPARALQQERREQMIQRRENKIARGIVPDRLKKVQEIKTAYITKKLDLTPEQSDKFWPLYNHYQLEMFQVNQQIRLNNSPSAANGKDQILNELSLEDKKSNIKRNYANEFLKILPPEKVSMIYKAEKDFQDEIVKQLKERKNEADN